MQWEFNISMMGIECMQREFQDTHDGNRISPTGMLIYP